MPDTNDTNAPRSQSYPATLKLSPAQQLAAALRRIEQLEAKVQELTKQVDKLMDITHYGE